MLRFFSVFIILVFLFSCSEDSDNGLGNNDNNINLGPGSLTMKIDGSNWSATQGVVFASISTEDTVSTVSITAGRSISPTEADAIALAISNLYSGNSDLLGTYSLDGTSISALAYTRTLAGNSSNYNAVSGQVTLTEITASAVKGTFNAVCQNSVDSTDTITITDGAFNAVITN